MTSLQPMSDQAALAHFADESSALAFAALVRDANPAWLVDVVGAYCSVAVYFDLERGVGYADVAEWLRQQEARPDHLPAGEGKRHRIPCCYEYHLDLDRVAGHTGLSSEQVIALHSGAVYTVYAIGFCPGFPYMGYLPPPLCAVPRLESPRLRVEAGSVGLTGRQTGIYTEPRPGGWNLVGRTPLVLVDVADGYFPLRTGDRVQFERVDEAEFRRLEGQRL
jgi:inhibitor of KinA